MKKCWNDAWLFAETGAGLSPEEVCRQKWTLVSLPHDFLIADADRLYRDADGWYLKTLFLTPEEAGMAVEIWFDGVYQDATVYVNGEKLMDHPYGYTSFCADLTGRVRAGENPVLVQVRHRAPCSRWYSGAGIFRDVTLVIRNRARLKKDGVYFHARRLSEGKWQVHAEAETLQAPEGEKVAFLLTGRDDQPLAKGESSVRDGLAVWETLVESAPVWSLRDPEWCLLTVTYRDGREQCRVGFRETEFTPDQGLFLNGERVKLRGVCLHHDLGALGAAFHEKALRRQLTLMKRMGANAVRTAHNPPARQLMDLCDEMGLLVVSELYDMWERPKTAFDHARFFEKDYAQNTAEWVCRDRNHPSLLMWSIGNEIQDMHVSERGAHWTRALGEEVLSHDPLGNGRVTFGSNYMPWEGAQRCAMINGTPGYNYGEKYYAPHHLAHPDWVIYGSETASHLQSRGIYHFPKGEDLLSDEDFQCSALGNSKTSWGTQDAEKMLREEEERPYTLGQFIWSGVDYIGEPTPYHTRCCYFGQADTACFPKDTYYMYRAAWSGEKVLHIGVYWDWNPGQTVDVPVWTNMEEVELFLNGRSLGRKQRGRGYSCVFEVPYEPGILLAVGRNGDGETLEDRRESFGDSVRLIAEWEEESLQADGEDMAFLTVRAVDAKGRTVENASDRVTVALSGPGCVLGMDNGDSTDTDGYQVLSRRLFSGRLLVILGALNAPGTLEAALTAPGLEGVTVRIPVRPASGPEEGRVRIPFPLRSAPAVEKREPRKIELTRLDAGPLTGDHDTAVFEYRLCPEGSRGEVSFRTSNPAGIPIPYAAVCQEDGRVLVRALGDGRIMLRATWGETHPRVLSVMDLEAQGLGKAPLDPYAFVSAGLADLREGEITPGNEQGISFSRDGWSMAGFSNVDFGRDGSDEVTLPVFALDDREYRIALWDGAPGAGGKQITALRYQKKSVWNVYQEETWRLPVRLKGIHTLCFSMEEKIHLKGFCFTRQSRSERPVCAGEADRIYGDHFRKDGDAVLDIGNNVTVAFEAMDFGGGGRAFLNLEGATPLESNPVALRLRGPDGTEQVAMLPFEGRDHLRGWRRFPVTLPAGRGEMSFVFLPGCRFDFYGFRLEREEDR